MTYSEPNQLIHPLYQDPLQGQACETVPDVVLFDSHMRPCTSVPAPQIGMDVGVFTA